MQTHQSPALQGSGESPSGSTSSGQLSSLSCVQCRSRKLKCDRKRPRCERCARQNERCTYPETKQRGLGRRRTVRELEERIEELEGLLRNASLNAGSTSSEQEGRGLSQGLPPSIEDFGLFNFDDLSDQHLSTEPLSGLDPAVQPVVPEPLNQLIDLGFSEQLPSFEMIDELTTLYFHNIHPGAPMLHQATYTAGLRLPPHMRPVMCLQYIVMASAAATSDKHRHLSEPFYRRARVYAEADELKGQGEISTTVGHAQAWCLISAYECHVYALFTRASTSLCRGVRIAQMLRLHQLDAQIPEAMQLGLPPPKNQVEAEERRRTWWVVFLADRFLTSITGWPSLIDESHIRTKLPASEEAFASGTDEATVPLSKGLQDLRQDRESHVSPFAIRILAANELLHALDHGARQLQDDDPGGIQDSVYWQRHKEIDENLGILTVYLPENLQIFRNPRSLDAILVHICTNMANIHLHRTALRLMQRHSLDDRLVARSQSRLLPAADGIVAVFRAAGDGVGTAIRNPLLSFAAYMASCVFLEDRLQGGIASETYFTMQEQDQSRQSQSEESLEFLANTLLSFARHSSLVRANAFQLATDMKRTGYDRSMMDRVMDQLVPEGGPQSEILQPGPKGLPMVFCPALISTMGTSHAVPGGLAIGSVYHGGGNRNHQIPLGDDNVSEPYMSASRGFAPFNLQAGSSSGLFSQFDRTYDWEPI
ncbi:hypothetical protein GE09DRAFT_968709 [Coniochaeta sp. 2T2.1]|nr:hypothetical protein GE09DRAFT_968709 [Coniochaeta sp. 2T2.1]